MNWKHFSHSEFDCKSGEPVPERLFANLDLLVGSVLEPIRERWGGPLTVISGYRDPEYNARISGAKASQHMLAKAADIAPLFTRTMSPAGRIAIVDKLYDLVLKMDAAGELPTLGGLGYYGGKWLHVDVRPRVASGRYATWRGNGIGSEVA